MYTLQEDIENSKKDWELARLKSLKEEEERRAEMEEDEMLYTYLRDDAQVKRRLAKAGKVKKGPGRPRLHSPRSPSLSSSDTGSGEVRTPSRISNRVALNKEKLRVVAKSRKKEEEREAVAGAGRKTSGVGARGRVVKVKVANGEPVQNGPTLKPPPAAKKTVPVKARKNNIAQKTIQNGEAAPQEVKTAGRKRGGEKVAVVRPKAEDTAGKAPVSVQKVPRKPGRPPAAQAVVQNPGAVGQLASRAILKVPTMASTPGTSIVVGSPPRNKSPATVTSPVTSPGNVPPPWSNPNLVIRTRRASIHSPVQVSGRQVIQGVPTLTQQQAGLLQPTGVVQQPIGVVQSGGVMRLVSPGPVVALATSQPLQVVSAGRVRTTMAAGIPAGQLSLAGARVITTPTQQVMSAAGLQGSLVRMPDGSTALLGQISGTNLLAAQSAANPTLIVSGAGQPTASPTFIVSGTGQNQVGARAVLASNLAAASRARAPGPRLATQPQVVSAAGLRTVQLGPGGLASPLTLRGVGVGGVSMGVNLVKAGASSVQIPIVGTQGLALRGGQIIQTNMGQTASPQSYVLITPRVRVAAPSAAPGDVNGPTEKKGAG